MLIVVPIMQHGVIFFEGEAMKAGDKFLELFKPQCPRCIILIISYSFFYEWEFLWKGKDQLLLLSSQIRQSPALVVVPLACIYSSLRRKLMMYSKVLLE